MKELRTSPSTNKWFLDPEVNNSANTVTGERISEVNNDRGWTANRDTVQVNGKGSPIHRAVRLKRVSETALEGKFTCNITNYTNNSKYVLILYPSECSFIENDYHYKSFNYL